MPEHPLLPHEGLFRCQALGGADHADSASAVYSPTEELHTQRRQHITPTPTPGTQTDAPTHEDDVSYHSTRTRGQNETEKGETFCMYLKNFREMVTVTLTRDPNSLIMKNTNSWPMPAHPQKAATFLITCFRCEM